MYVVKSGGGQRTRPKTLQSHSSMAQILRKAGASLQANFVRDYDSVCPDNSRLYRGAIKQVLRGRTGVSPTESDPLPALTGKLSVAFADVGELDGRSVPWHTV